jgi:hypothetical protein
MATDEGLLQEIVDELRDAFEKDLPRAMAMPEEDDLSILYPTFMDKVKHMAEEFKESGGYRRLCKVPSFALALVMVSRIRRHYTHCSWFKISTLQTMLSIHGGVGV